MENVPTSLPAEQSPLSIKVTDTGRESVVLRALIRQAIPMLERPESYRTEERRQFARTLKAALQGNLPIEAIPFEPTDADVPPEDDACYEPGCLPELPEEVWPC